VQRATARVGTEWFALLDAWDGTTHNHTEIARHVCETYGIDGWWAQSVTVGYERARGMRALHERPDAFPYECQQDLSRPVERLFAAFVEHDRARSAGSKASRAAPSHPASRPVGAFRRSAGETRLAITFCRQRTEKAALSSSRSALAGAEDVARWKALWKGAARSLASYLTEER
jgi:hypothetical protein